ncbi:hypothetical protein [Thermanaeromonas toyohensis]|nr:hypothetical protein [Thermanaeromonas toyohensis]
MIWLNFGRWSSAAGRFIYERIYINGWRWTPFVRIKRRKTTVTCVG